MTKLAFGLGFILIAILVAGSIWMGVAATTANLVQAQANVYQAQANATLATTGLIDKCLSGFLLIFALAAGISLGAGAQKLWNLNRRSQHPTLPIQNPTPGKNAGQQALPTSTMLLTPDELAMLHQLRLARGSQTPSTNQMVAWSEEEDDFHSWGW